MVGNLLQEFRRRGVFRAAAAYLAIAWLVLQVVDTLSGFVSLSEWLGVYLLLALAAGFPITIVVAWAYELTPQGIVATTSDTSHETNVAFGGRKVDFVIIGALSLVIVLLVLNTVIAPNPSRGGGALPAVSEYTQLTQSRFVLPPTPSPYPIVADATRVYFSSFEFGRIGIQQVSQAGGDAIPFDTTELGEETEFRPLSLSPDGSSIAMNGNVESTGIPEEFWLIPVVGGPARKLGRAGDATFSFDGSKIAYESEFGAISVANADLTDAKEILRSDDRIHWIRFSPDAQRLRYNKIHIFTPLYMFPFVGSMRQAIWEVDIDGGDPRPVFPELSQVTHCCGVWSPDGRFYVFQVQQGSRTQLYAVAEGTDDAPVQITTSPIDFRRPAFAQNSNRIFAVSWQIRGEVSRYDSRAAAFVPIEGFEGMSAELLNYSPDGQVVAYLTSPENELWRSNRDGSERRQLTSEPLRVAGPVWSPDGRYIAFFAASPNETARIYIVSANGGPVVPIEPGSAPQAFPSWASDSRSIVFLEDGKDLLQRFDVETREKTDVPGTEGLNWPSLSPDGRRIAGRSDAGLEIVDLDSDSRKTFVDDWTMLEQFYWQDDDTLMLVDFFFRGKDRAIRRYDLRSGEISEVAVTGGTPSIWGAVGMWVGIDPDGTPMILKDVSIHHIYALDWLP